MRKIFKTIKENFILLFGTGLFTYGLFSFNSHYYSELGKTGVGLPSLGTHSYPVSISTYYYYDQTSLILLTIGVIFIVIGLLEMRKRRSEN